MNLRARHRRSRRSASGCLRLLSAIESKALSRLLKWADSTASLRKEEVSALSSRVIPVTLGQFFVMPVRGDEAPDYVTEHPEVMPIAELIELARARERLHSGDTREALTARAAETSQC